MYARFPVVESFQNFKKRTAVRKAFLNYEKSPELLSFITMINLLISKMSQKRKKMTLSYAKVDISDSCFTTIW